MLYLLDANVLITAHDSYYPIDGVPEFWAWLSYKGVSGDLKMPLETYEEVRDGGNDDPLFAWVQAEANKAAILYAEEVDRNLVQQIIAVGYAPDLTEVELEQIGRDPFLIAYALAAPADRCVVTNEVSSPSRRRQNRKIPDVCASVGVQCCNTFAMLRALQFSTNWQQPAQV